MSLQTDYDRVKIQEMQVSFPVTLTRIERKQLKEYFGLLRFAGNGVLIECLAKVMADETRVLIREAINNVNAHPVGKR